MRELAERSGVSVRFLVQLEAGRGNISVQRLAELARAFDVRPRRAPDRRPPTCPRVVALLGLRGAGKTTIGKQLARRLHVPFVELDRRIEQAADMSLAELFSLYGEDHYRRLERETLTALMAERRPMVLATGGGIVDVAADLRAAPAVGRDRLAACLAGGSLESGRPPGRSAADGGPSTGNGGLARAAGGARIALRDRRPHDRHIAAVGSSPSSRSSRLRCWRTDSRPRTTGPTQLAVSPGLRTRTSMPFGATRLFRRSGVPVSSGNVP